MVVKGKSQMTSQIIGDIQRAKNSVPSGSVLRHPHSHFIQSPVAPAVIGNRISRAGCFFELSGGMKQRVGIAMSMTARPKLLLADEPTSALDVTIQAEVVREMKKLREQYQAAIILVTHNMGVASYISDKIGVMCQGKLVEFGKRDDVIFHPKHEYTRSLLAAVPRLEGKRFAK